MRYKRDGWRRLKSSMKSTTPSYWYGNYFIWGWNDSTPLCCKRKWFLSVSNKDNSVTELGTYGSLHAAKYAAAQHMIETPRTSLEEGDSSTKA